MLNLGCGSSFHEDWENYDLVPSAPSVKPIDLTKPLPFEDGTFDVVYSSHVLEHIPRQRVPALLREMARILKPGGILRIVVPDLEGIIREYLRQLDLAAAGDRDAVARHEWMTIELLDQLTRDFSGGFMGRYWMSRPLPARDFIGQRLGREAGDWIDRCDVTGSAPFTPQTVYDAELPAPETAMAFRQTGENHRWMYDRVSLANILLSAGFENPRRCAAVESAIPEFKKYGLDTESSGEVRKPDSLFMEAVRAQSA
ncbi:MAG TPA: methyltransferase domain-containing protein [Chthoniobacterales bacterium]